jgi:enoyl-CoA hydratase/carnithine racemase
MPYNTLRYERDGHVTFITLNRPHRLNALDDELMHECGRAWREFKADPEQWVAVVSGSGKAFCAGGDVKQFDSQLKKGESPITTEAFADDLEFRGWGPRHYDVHKPIVVAVHGVCTGGGLDFATEGDIVVASEDAEFFDSHVSIGWVSGHEAVQLAQRLPVGEALQLALLGNEYRLSAARGYELGFVQALVPTGDALSRATEIAHKIAGNSPGAVWGTKQSIWRSLGVPIGDALPVAKRYIADQVARDDFVEGPRAMGERRAAQWVSPSDWTSH